MIQHLRFEKLTDRNFSSFKSLMCTDSISKQCFCLGHRVEPKDLELDSLAEKKMCSLVANRRVHGLVAFEDQNPIAWIGIEPFSTLVGHDVFEMLLQNPRHGQFGEKDWAIHCLFVAPNFRGQGLTSLMVDHASKYAVDRGAESLLAFPPPPERVGQMDPYEKYTGSPSLFLEKGFAMRGRLSPNTCLMVKKIISGRPRLSVQA